MSSTKQRYCLDTNVLLQAWNSYYSYSICPDYWVALNSLADSSKIFVPESVVDEILKKDDSLASWVKNDSRIPILRIDHNVSECLKRIYNTDPSHARLVDSIKGRSLADPWVIAHAMNEQATVVTKEPMVTSPNSKRIKIPNVCNTMNIRCINDFTMIDELNIRFKCSL